MQLIKDIRQILLRLDDVCWEFKSWYEVTISEINLHGFWLYHSVNLHKGQALIVIQAIRID